MVEELLRIYEASRLNAGQPECMFNPTLIFNEGWLLRAVLRHWQLGKGGAWPFLPFPADAAIYSEGQLFTPFAARRRGDALAESHTHVDGIAGHFSIGSTKSGIELRSDCGYLAVFEAKLYSAIASGTSHAPGYDQVSRTVACVINSVVRAGCPTCPALHVVVLFPADHMRVSPARYQRSYLAERIEARIAEFGLAPAAPFVRRWREVFEQVQLSFLTWEAVLAQCGDERLREFYALCLRFSR